MVSRINRIIKKVKQALAVVIATTEFMMDSATVEDIKKEVVELLERLKKSGLLPGFIADMFEWDAVLDYFIENILRIEDEDEEE